MSIFITLIIFGIIVIIHEFGHFYAAKKCGVGIVEFAVGMGPKVISFNKNGVLYSLRIIPLGGFCRMKGEEADDPDCFQNVSLVKRIIIVLAGPFMNFLLAFIIFAVFAMFVPMATTKIIGFSENSPAYAAGLRENDKIIKLNDSPIHIYSDLDYFMGNFKGGDITVKAKNSKGVKTVVVTPTQISDKAGGKYYIMGVMCQNKLPFFGKNIEGYEKASFFESIQNGFWYVPFMEMSIMRQKPRV